MGSYAFSMYRISLLDVRGVPEKYWDTRLLIEAASTLAEHTAKALYMSNFEGSAAAASSQ